MLAEFSENSAELSESRKVEVSKFTTRNSELEKKNYNLENKTYKMEQENIALKKESKFLQRTLEKAKIK